MRALAIVSFLAVAIGLGMPADAYVGAGYKVRACTGNATTDTATLKAALQRGGLLILPACQYVVSSTLRIKTGVHLVGAGVSATTIRSTITNGSPLIDSSSSAYLSNVRISDMSLVGPFGTGQTGTGDALHLYAATNIVVFQNLRIANFRGNAFFFGTQSANPGDPLSVYHVDFQSIRIENVGGYGFDITYRVDATWEDITIDSPVLGGFRFRKGSAVQSFISIRNLVANWSKSWSSPNHVVVFDVANYQVVNFEGCKLSVSTAARPANLTFIRTNSTLYPNLIGCTATGARFKNWIADTKNPQNSKPYATSINFRF